MAKKAKKDIAKSFRMTQEVFDYLSAAPGKGYNEQFENIVLEAKRGEKDRRAEISRLDREIKAKQEKNALLFEQNCVLKDFFRDFLTVQHDLERLKSQIQNVAALQKKMEDLDHEQI